MSNRTSVEKDDNDEFSKAMLAIEELVGRKRAIKYLAEELAEYWTEIIAEAYDDLSACNIGEIIIRRATEPMKEAAEWEEQCSTIDPPVISPRRLEMMEEHNG